MEKETTQAGRHPKLRRLLLYHKVFLYKIYSVNKSHTTRRNIQKATIGQLRTLARILFCIERGHIPIKSENYTKVVKSRRLNQLLKIRKKLPELLKAPIGFLKKYLCQFATLYPILLHPLFIEY